MELLKAPPPLQLTGNLSEQWKRFKQKFDLFIVATTTKEQPRTEAAKAALLRSVAGDEALDVFNTFKFEAHESKEDYATIVEKFESYCSEYVPGKHLVLADMLSRSAPASHEDIAGAADDVEVHAVLVLGYLVTGATRQKLVQETARDGYFSTVISNLSSGESLQGELKPFRQSFPS
ncbi:uncharacterized protein [Dermacentor albipictus]|uniref:uncharacterized protein isoform X1 n=1 Tax=Dermacentor albipictus TaxID=60249 RepID=UPI0038FC7E59